VLLCLAVFATASRTGSVILVAAVVAWLVWAIWHRRGLKPVIVIIVVLGFDYWLFGALSPDLKTAAFESTSLQTGMSVRWSMVESAFRIALDTGFVGTGLFTFSLLYPAYRSLDDQSTSGVLVHNDYVQLLVEGGPLLLFPLGVLVVATIIVLWRSFDREQGMSFRHGCALALATVLAHAMVNFVFYSLVLCVVVGVLSFLRSPTIHSPLSHRVCVRFRQKPVGSRSGYLALDLGACLGFTWRSIRMHSRCLAGNQVFPARTL
jgi:O-antigen ligase